MTEANGNGYTDRERAIIKGMGKAFREQLEEVRNANPSRPLHIDLTPPVLPNMQYRVDVPAPEVTVTNQVAAPVVNVSSPDISVEAPTVNVEVDMGPVAEALDRLSQREADEVNRLDRILKALKLMGDQQKDLLGQVLLAVKGFAEGMQALADAVGKQPPIEVKPNIQVAAPNVTVRQPQPLPRVKPRVVKVEHSDGTSSTLTEE